MDKQDYITLILAGGRGERLGSLTKETPKPAIPFGGAYRLIDFTLSNCAHSHSHHVGILTQYCHDDLANYIGEGSPWIHQGDECSITILPPKLDPVHKQLDLYKGTADALWKNRDFIEYYEPENILVLSGDHIYKMDYTQMLQDHFHSGADCTIAALQIPLEIASNFGIIQTNDSMYITGFEEKPRTPKSDLASMGVYVFKWTTLKKRLYADSQSRNTRSDIGNDIIPRMLLEGDRMAVYRFREYWKDVGSICGLWEAHMDLLEQVPQIKLLDEGWTIISREKVRVTHFDYYQSNDSHISNAIIADGSDICGSISRSVIFDGVSIQKNAVISNSVIMPRAIIGQNAVIHNAIIGANTLVEDDMVIDGGVNNNPKIEHNRGIALYTNTPLWKRSASVG